MAKPSISVPDWMWDEVNERRESDEEAPDFETRSDFVQAALQARFNAEDAGEWTTPEIEEPNGPPLPDGGSDAA